jgi:hypothetical protein
MVTEFAVVTDKEATNSIGVEHWLSLEEITLERTSQQLAGVNYDKWYDSKGGDCSWYETNETPGCPYWGTLEDAGYRTPGVACCHCDGGLVIN